MEQPRIARLLGPHRRDRPTVREWHHPDSNRGHAAFQTAALPTELQRHGALGGIRTPPTELNLGLGTAERIPHLKSLTSR